MSEKQTDYPIPAYIYNGCLYLYEACTPCHASADWLPDGCIKPHVGFEGIGTVYRPASRDHDIDVFDALERAVKKELKYGRVLESGRYKLTRVKRAYEDLREVTLEKDTDND